MPWVRFTSMRMIGSGGGELHGEHPSAVDARRRVGFSMCGYPPKVKVGRMNARATTFRSAQVCVHVSRPRIDAHATLEETHASADRSTPYAGGVLLPAPRSARRRGVNARRRRMNHTIVIVVMVTPAASFRADEEMNDSRRVVGAHHDHFGCRSLFHSPPASGKTTCSAGDSGAFQLLNW